MEVTPSYQRWRTTVRQRIGQTIRTRNFKTRNERFDTGALAESHKGRDVSAERKVEECCTDAVTDTDPFPVKEHNSPSTLRTPTQTGG